MRRVKENGCPRRSFREILNDRALTAALLFSAAAHLIVFYQVKFPSGDTALETGRLMVARLVRGPAAISGGEEETVRQDGPEVMEREGWPAASAEFVRQAEGADGKIGVAAAGGVLSAFMTARGPGGASLHLSPSPLSLKMRQTAPSLRPGGSARTAFARTEVPERTAQRHLNEIRRLIDSRKVYPRIALRNGWEGRVLVELSLADGGALEDVQIVAASGHRVLDSATVRAVRAAGPYPPLEGKVRVPVTYRLER